MGKLGDDAGEPLIFGSGIDEQAAKDDLAAGIEAATFGSDAGVQCIETGLGLSKTLLRQFNRFRSGSSHTFSVSKHDHGPSIAQTNNRSHPRRQKETRAHFSITA
ncbi:hypothetical protein SPHINGO391_310006 [Sphingomonas aurantiaca]|uniref:Uncharacterized protein n=1 Tax=Sphingomonas aurantiaca TaxID=185949 RepID=A0A5E7Y295_9SPHN|nr:hypothetical protein SPHINGO391_310006 [Sphingomonas aurantiaca]